MRLLRRAETAIDVAILWHRQARGPVAAARFEEAVTEALGLLAAMPEIYALHRGPHRLCPVKKSDYLIVYRYEESVDTVVVVNLIHARQDPATWQFGANGV